MLLRASRNKFGKSRLAINNFLRSIDIPFSSYSSAHLQQKKRCALPPTKRKSHFSGPNGQKEFGVRSSVLVTLKSGDDIARFSIDPSTARNNKIQTKANEGTKHVKKSKKAKLKELRFFRLKAKKKMKSPNPEVRIRYKLGKAKRKEEWLIEKLRKFELPRGVDPICDPEILTEEERFYLKRTGEKKKNYVNVGRRGVFGGVVLNMHLHWKKHETVKVVCRPCRPGQVHEYAEEISRLSKGIIIDVAPNNTILFYRGKNYVQPHVMSPPDTLSKQKALEKYKLEQSLEHTGQYIEKLEMELEEYRAYVASYKNRDDQMAKDPKKG
ncbi:RNA-binding CRS1 / YhbY (CRM) domain protein [Wolffia australiana]